MHCRYTIIPPGTTPLSKIDINLALAVLQQGNEHRYKYHASWPLEIMQDIWIRLPD